MLCSSSQSLRQLIFSHSTLLVGGSQFFSKSHLWSSQTIPLMKVSHSSVLGVSSIHRLFE